MPEHEELATVEYFLMLQSDSQIMKLYNQKERMNEHEKRLITEEFNRRFK